jgi:hypothetical protein
VFALYLAKEKVSPEVVENIRSWPHSGFSVAQSVYLPAGDRAGIERLVGYRTYRTRCPFSLSRLVKVTETGQVIYKAEKQACRALAEPQGAVIEKILRHCGLWHSSRGPPAGGDFVHAPARPQPGGLRRDSGIDVPHDGFLC